MYFGPVQSISFGFIQVNIFNNRLTNSPNGNYYFDQFESCHVTDNSQSDVYS